VNYNVKKWTSEAVCRIAEFHPQCILSLFDLSLDIMLESLQSVNKVGKNMCWSFFHLAENIQDLNKNHLFFLNFDKICQTVLNLSALPNQDVTFIDIAFAFILSFLKNSQSIPLSQQYLTLLIQLLSSCGQITNKSQRETFKKGVFTGIHCCLYNLENIQQNDMRVIYAIVKREFELLRDVNDDGIVVLCALCFASKEAFAEVLPEVFAWIKLALDKIHEKEVFKVALDFISQASKNCTVAFEQYVQMLVPPLLTCLNRQDFNNELKLNIFECLGDISLYYPQ